METKDALYIGLGVAAVYMAYKWTTRNQLTSDEKAQFIAKSTTSGGAQQSTLNPSKILLPATGGTYRVDPTELNATQRWLVENNLYKIESDTLTADPWKILAYPMIEPFRRLFA